MTTEVRIAHLIKLAALSKTLTEITLAARALHYHGDAGISALVAFLTHPASSHIEIIRVLAVLESMCVMSRMSIAAALERILLTRPEVELHRAVLPSIIVHVKQGREDALLAVEAFKQRGGERAAQLVSEAYQLVERL